MSDFERIGPRNRIENIEIDEVTAVESFCEAIQGKSPDEQIQAVREFLQNNLLNALNPHAHIPPDVNKRIWDQKTTKTMSVVFKDRYGVCLDWHVVGQAILNKLGIETVFQTGQPPWGGPAHTYLDTKVGDRWVIFDPFADQYLKDAGHQGGNRLFPEEYYEASLSRKRKK